MRPPSAGHTNNGRRVFRLLAMSGPRPGCSSDLKPFSGERAGIGNALASAASTGQGCPMRRDQQSLNDRVRSFRTGYECSPKKAGDIARHDSGTDPECNPKDARVVFQVSMPK